MKKIFTPWHLSRKEIARMKARLVVKVRLQQPVVKVGTPPPPLVEEEEGERLRLGETRAGEWPAGAATGARKVSSHLSPNTEEIMFLHQNLPRPQTRPPGRRARSRRGRSAWPTRPSAAAASRAASALSFNGIIQGIGRTKVYV